MELSFPGIRKKIVLCRCRAFFDKETFRNLLKQWSTALLYSLSVM